MPQTSLLAHLYPYFKGSQEDVATSSLNYIVSSTDKINAAFTHHISKILETPLTGTFQYKCQAVGDNKERPDMAGFDQNGNERILCESKFYAPLTINQPNTYLKRLIEEKGIGLMFICPDIRKNGLWSEITKSIDPDFNTTIINEFCWEINNSVHLGITTWTELLSELEQTANINATTSVADIKQLQGYCEQLDSEAFIPFIEEDLGIDRAMKAERPYRLLDELTDSIQNTPNHKVTLKGLKSTPIWSGYRKYLYIDGYAVNLEFDTNKWKRIDGQTTPFWMYIKKRVNNKWVQDESCIKAMLKIPSDMKYEEYIALIPKKYVALSEVVEDMKRQVFDYIKIFAETDT